MAKRGRIHLGQSLFWHPDTPAAAPSVPEIPWLQGPDPVRRAREGPWTLLALSADPTPVPVPSAPEIPQGIGHNQPLPRDRDTRHGYESFFYGAPPIVIPPTPATPWTELTTAQTGWMEAFPDGSYLASEDYFIDVLFEGTGFFAVIPTAYTELSAPVTNWTELTN